MPSDASKPVEWQVFLLRKRAQWVGRVRAMDEDEARQRALEELQIPEAERFRLSVQRVAG